MIVGVPKETAAGERRVALVPDAVKPLKAKGIELLVQTGAGEAAGFADAAYVQAGATLEADLSALVGRADLIAKVQGPRALAGAAHEADALRAGQVLIGALRPLDQPELAARLAQRRVTAFALELMPRITRAQAMDVLSSMATIAGYHAVLLAAAALPKFFPMLDDGRRNDLARARARDRRRRGGPAGDRHRAAARRGGRGVRRAPGREGAGPEPRRQVRRARRSKPGRAGRRRLRARAERGVLRRASASCSGSGCARATS